MNKQGLIRVGSRLKNSNLSFDVHHLILLPRDHVLIKTRNNARALTEQRSAGTQTITTTINSFGLFSYDHLHERSS